MASVIHINTVKAMMPSMRFPATDNPAGVGAITMAVIISRPRTMMIGFLSIVFLPTAFVSVDPLPGEAMSFPLMIRFQSRSGPGDCQAG